MTEELYKAEEVDVLARKYLDDCGCSQSLQGYFILVKVIGFAVYAPNATSRELFKKFTEQYNDYGNPKNQSEKISTTSGDWLRAYKSARYCYMTAGSANGRDFFSFIRQGANTIFEKTYLKRKKESLGGASG